MEKRIAVIFVLILILGIMVGCRAAAPVRGEKAIEEPISPKEAIPEVRPVAPMPIEEKPVGEAIREPAPPVREVPPPRPPIIEERKGEAIERPAPPAEEVPAVRPPRVPIYIPEKKIEKVKPE